MRAPSPDTPDGVLLAAARRGDRSAFEAIVVRHQGPLFRTAMARCGDEARAEDVVQQVFVALWRQMTSKDAGEIGHVRGWLFGTLRHVASHEARRRAGEPARFDDIEDVDDLAIAAGFGADDPESRSSLAERRALVSHGLSLLDEDDRLVLELRDIEQIAGNEVAHMLGLSIDAMKSRLHRARLRLMGELRTLLREGAGDAR